MDFGVHLPILDFRGNGYSLENLRAYAKTAQQLGYRTLATNDHLWFSRPWLDGLTALSAVIDLTGDMSLMTTVTLPVIRGPAALAKTLSALDILSGGRLIAGVGPGSSTKDYAAVGIPFEERWKRFDESVLAMRAIWNPDAPPFVGQFYDTRDIHLEPTSAPPIWIGSWGSDAGLRRVARLGDGWLASGYNTTPDRFANGLQWLHDHLGERGASFPNAIATMWMYITDDQAEANHFLRDVLLPVMRRDESELRDLVPIGPVEECAAKMAAYRDRGAQRIFVWPLADEIEQITRFMEEVVPLV